MRSTRRRCGAAPPAATTAPTTPRGPGGSSRPSWPPATGPPPWVRSGCRPWSCTARRTRSSGSAAARPPPPPSPGPACCASPASATSSRPGSGPPWSTPWWSMPTAPTVPEPLRVVFLAHAFPRWAGDPTGGFLLRLATALAAEGVRVAAVAPAAEGLATAELLDGVPVRRYRYAPARAERLAYAGEMHRRAAAPAGAVALAGLLGAGAMAARRAARGADLVHAHWWFPAGVQALAARTGLPLVTTLHGTDVRLARTRPAARAACARVLRASARVTAVSGWLADQAAGFAPGLARPIAVAPMPVDDLAFSPGPADRPGGRPAPAGRRRWPRGAGPAPPGRRAGRGRPGPLGRPAPPGRAGRPLPPGGRAGGARPGRGAGPGRGRGPAVGRPGGGRRLRRPARRGRRRPHRPDLRPRSARRPGQGDRGGPGRPGGHGQDGPGRPGAGRGPVRHRRRRQGVRRRLRRGPRKARRLAPVLLPGGVGDRAGAVAHAQLGQHVADVVGGGLAADEQALGDLGVGQAEADQPQHLLLAPGQLADALGAGPAGRAKGAQQGVGRVGVPLRPQRLERPEGAPGFGDRQLEVLGGPGAG